jgi:hypothetical protein
MFAFLDLRSSVMDLAHYAPRDIFAQTPSAHHRPALLEGRSCFMRSVNEHARPFCLQRREGGASTYNFDISAYCDCGFCEGTRWAG